MTSTRPLPIFALLGCALIAGCRTPASSGAGPGAASSAEAASGPAAEPTAASAAAAATTPNAPTAAPAPTTATAPTTAAAPTTATAPPAATAPSGEAVPTATKRPKRGAPCGKITCAPGEICCNKSCGICTPPDGLCTQQICDEEKTPNVPAIACAKDADCRLFSDYCTGCTCRPLAAGSSDPSCPGPGVRCLADPCRDRVAVCEQGACTTRAKRR